MTPEPGRRIGPYLLQEKIGEGGMGVVWKARDTSLDRDVALKFLPEAFARDPERLARFEREAKAVAALAHPGILAIHGFGSDDGTAFAVTELLEGRTLREALREGPLPHARAAAIARGVAEGLAAAHERGIVHRDLKPENLFLTSDGRTKILDFGLAAVVPAGEASDDTRTPTRTSLTTPGVVMGTTGYMSPEQVRGGAVDARSDLFSLGTVLWEMLTGTRPFRRETDAETMAAILGELPGSLPNGIPAFLRRAAHRCLEKHPERRFASARDLVAALDPGLDARRRLRIAAAVAGAALVAAAGGGAWVATRGPAPSGGAAPAVSLTSIGEPRSPNVEANEEFERAMLFIRSQLDLPRARQMLQRTVERDPEFASARAMLGLTELIAIHEGYSDDATQLYAVEGAIRQVLRERPDTPSAHAVLGAILLYLNRKEPARAELREALRLNAQSQPAIVWLALDARLSGRDAEAEEVCRRILAEVPLFWPIRVFLAESRFEGGHADEARRELEKVLEQDPHNLAATRALARVEIHEGDLAGARARLERIDAAGQANHRVRIVWALLLAREGKKDEAVAALEGEALRYAGLGMFAAWQAAEVYAVAGRPNEALDWLDRGVRNGDERVGWLRRNGLLSDVRDLPRFRSILDAVERGRN